MNFDKSIIEHGQLDIAEIETILDGFTDTDWNSDSEFRNRLTGPRPGASLLLLTNTDFNDQQRWQRELRQGYLSVYKRHPWKVLGECTQKLLDQISRYYPETDTVRVQYAVLPPGEEIPRHADTRILRFFHRLHVPIVTHKDVVFYVENESYTLERGRLYELNNVRIHSVKNNSQINRVHLLVDLLRHQDAKQYIMMTTKQWSMLTRVDHTATHYRSRVVGWMPRVSSVRII